MGLFFVAGQSIELPALAVQPRAATRDRTAWRFGDYRTVRFYAPEEGIRAHTAEKAYPGRAASTVQGVWFALADYVMTSNEFADSRSLPTSNANSMTAAPYAARALVVPHCVLNIGIASAKFGGAGGGVQAEYVSGPRVQFIQLPDNRWHGHTSRFSI